MRSLAVLPEQGAEHPIVEADQSRPTGWGDSRRTVLAEFG
jgi:hypothetical protein